MGEPFFFDRNNYADLVRMEVLRVKISVVQHDIAIHMAIIQTIGLLYREVHRKHFNCRLCTAFRKKEQRITWAVAVLR